MLKSIFEIFIFIGCFSSLAKASVYNPKAIWPKEKNSLQVCVYTSTASEKQVFTNIIADVPSQIINLSRDAILKSFSYNDTILSFSGFESCDDSLNFDIILVYTNDKLGSGSATQYGQDAQSVVRIGLGKSHVALDNKAFNLLESVVLHEFGHIAGLMHEHEYFIEQAIEDPSCNIDGYLGVIAEDLLITRKYFKDRKRRKGKRSYGNIYDPSSIMNYCHINSDGPAELSERDKKNIKIYV